MREVRTGGARSPAAATRHAAYARCTPHRAKSEASSRLHCGFVPHARARPETAIALRKEATGSRSHRGAPTWKWGWSLPGLQRRRLRCSPSWSLAEMAQATRSRRRRARNWSVPRRMAEGIAASAVARSGGGASSGSTDPRLSVSCNARRAIEVLTIAFNAFSSCATRCVISSGDASVAPAFNCRQPPLVSRVIGRRNVADRFQRRLGVLENRSRKSSSSCRADAWRLGSTGCGPFPLLFAMCPPWTVSTTAADPTPTTCATRPHGGDSRCRRKNGREPGPLFMLRIEDHARSEVRSASSTNQCAQRRPHADRIERASASHAACTGCGRDSK